MPGRGTRSGDRRRPPGRRDGAAGAVAVAMADLEVTQHEPHSMLAIGAAAVVAIAGAFVLSRSGPEPTVGSSPTPGVTPISSPSGSSSAVAGGPIPSQLRGTWMGEHRGLVAPEAGSLITLDQSSFYLAQSAGSAARWLESDASATGDGHLRLQSTLNTNACDQGDVGTYSWTLNPSARILTITEEGDDCPTRAGALEGVWWLMDCPLMDDNCLGAVDAGTYKSQFITPRGRSGRQLESRLRRDHVHRPRRLGERRRLARDIRSRAGIGATAKTQRSGPGDQSQHATKRHESGQAVQRNKPARRRPVRRRPRHLARDGAEWLITSAPTAITIGGHSGQWLDVRIDPAWTKKCADGTGPIVTYMMPGTAVMGTERERLILLDLGDGDVLQILVWTKDQAAFDAFLPEAMGVIGSFQFK